MRNSKADMWYENNANYFKCGIKREAKLVNASCLADFFKGFPDFFQNKKADDEIRADRSQIEMMEEFRIPR